jgi:hypothetical protein
MRLIELLQTLQARYLKRRRRSHSPNIGGKVPTSMTKMIDAEPAASGFPLVDTAICRH